MTTALTAVALAAGPAYAQNEDEDAAEDEGYILVTASRTAQSGLDAPTPTQVVDGEVIDRQAATTIMEVLNQNPAFKATRSPGATATNIGNPGSATADLRALGGQRTLVLVNGSRIVPSAPASNLGVPITTDLNLIPTIMVDRVDVVTGGASALYGSDAISGVVNLILKKKYEGIDARVQAGISEEGDSETLRAGFVAGTSFADDRAHLVVSLDYSDNKGVRTILDRDWGRKQQMIVSNGQRATNGLEAFILANNVNNSLGEGGVIITTGLTGLTGMTFNKDGSIRPFQYGAIRGGQVMIGGEGRSIIAETSLIPQVERFTAYGSLYYDLSDSVTAYIEGGWSRSKAQTFGVPIRLSSQVIQRDNAYVPAAVLALLPSSRQSFNISKIAYENNLYTITQETPHGVIGLEGEFGGGWKFDAHASYGINYFNTTSDPNPINANLQFAIDAVRDPATGNIVCRAVLQNNPAAAGCVPINLFGPDNISQAGIDYIMGRGDSDVKYKQFSVGANLVGELFEMPAGPLTVAVGGEYRRETEVLTSDPIGAVNGFQTAGNYPPYSGKFDVVEGYIEATVPVFDMLDLNGAVRYADYSTVGGQTAWKLGGVFEPFNGFNIRVSRSRDIRAPAINELFSPGGNVTNTVVLAITDNGTTKTKSATIPQNTSKGNPNVGPEFANTWTAGFAYRGSGALSGLGISADYYNIKIKGAITNLSTVNIANLCNQGDQFFCNLFTYGVDPNAPNERIHTNLIAGAQNVGGFEQEGIDMTLSYTSNVGFMGDGGRYSMNASGTYIFNAIVDTGTGAAPIDRAGENGWANLGAIPTFRGNLSQTLGNDDLEVTLQTIFISGGKQDATYNTAATNTINDNTVPDIVYFNLFGKFMVGEDKDFEFFWAINNLLDKDPPATPYIILNGPVNGQYYDKVGRNYMAGVRVRF
ncbi:MAG: TonB-dependent receptor [Blastomonas sp.]